MTLRDLLHGVTAQPVASIPIAGIARESNRVRPGDLFIAIPGATTDGHLFIDEAIRRGAAAILAERLPMKSARACPCIVVPSTRHAMAMVAARFYGHPSRKLRLIGVTGTNGKTTTSYLVKSILELSGARTGLIGTIVYQIGDRILPSNNTTPGPLELQRYFAQMVGHGTEWCTLEVSSHALAQDRLAGLELEAALFTNLGSDHLDYHKTADAYAAAKRRLFEYLRPGGLAVINTDDDFGRTLAETIPNRTILTYGIQRNAMVRAREIVCSWQGIRAILDTPWGVVPIISPLLGKHNVSNIISAAATLLALGISPDVIRDGLSVVVTVPGRLERVANETGVHILIDYAHTADGLRLALQSLRELTNRRLLVVFGCGGNRDRTKRPMMGRIGSLLSDHVVLTSDNPRNEDPLEIIRQIQSGFRPGFRDFQIVPDREEAITSVLSAARPDDVVLIAGKGHETYQVFDRVAVPFSDREVVERWAGARQSVALSESVSSDAG